jgi:glucose-6-phosphate 1-dehydrogenase
MTESVRDVTRLLGDAMKGDPLLFARQDAVEAEWRIVTPILTSPTPPHGYQAGSCGPAEADRLIAHSGGWHKPQPSPAKKSRSEGARS